MVDTVSRNICSIEDSIDLNEKHQSVVDRYYTRKFCVDVREKGDDYSVLVHSNGVCLLSLAPSHILMKSTHTIESVSFQVSKEINRLKNKVSGKLKHGAQKVRPVSPLLIAKLKDGSSRIINCSIAGKLLEVNERLIEEPNLMISNPDDIGYIAVVLPDQKSVQTYRDNLLGKDEYFELMNSMSPIADTLTSPQIHN
nr:simiate [Rhagovelia obesa]